MGSRPGDDIVGGIVTLGHMTVHVQSNHRKRYEAVQLGPIQAILKKQHNKLRGECNMIRKLKSRNC